MRTAPERFDVAFFMRVLRVVSVAEFKVKYADSALGYVWTIAKPLAWLAVLYVVFGRFFKLRATFENYTVYLLIGLVLWVFFLDATTLALQSFVQHAAVLRRLSIPRIVIPLSSSLTTALTLAVNAIALVIVVAIIGIEPRWTWLLLPLPLAELCVFTGVVALFLATVFVRARDVGPVLGHRDAADVLRIADHLPDRVSSHMGPEDRIRESVRADDAGRPLAGIARARSLHGRRCLWNCLGLSDSRPRLSRLSRPRRRSSTGARLHILRSAREHRHQGERDWTRRSCYRMSSARHSKSGFFTLCAG